MEATITNLSQTLSLLDGTAAHVLSIALPNGLSFDAMIDEETAAAIAVAFVQSGSDAAQYAVQQTRAEPARVESKAAGRLREALARTEPTPQAAATGRQYVPMEVAGGDGDEAADVQTFGGDFTQSIGDQLKQAADVVSSAALNVDPDDPTAVHKAAQALRGMGDLPLPNWAAPNSQTKQQVPARRRALRVSQDEAGNPILAGPGVANHRALIGGSGVEEGDTGQL